MTTDNKEYRCLSKTEIATLCGVSISTIQQWLNHRYFNELKKLGYCRNQKILLPPQVKFIFERLVIVED